MRKYYLRKNETDFHNWCKRYVRDALKYIKWVDANCRGVDRVFESKNYHESLIIVRQYKVLMASLTLEQQEFFDRSLVHNEHYRDSKRAVMYRLIFDLWKEICFPQNRSKVQTLDKYSFGKTLLELRHERCLSATRVAELVNINYATLISYESGERLVRADVLYRLSQLYEISVDEIIERSNPVPICVE